MPPLGRFRSGAAAAPHGETLQTPPEGTLLGGPPHTSRVTLTGSAAASHATSAVAFFGREELPHLYRQGHRASDRPALCASRQQGPPYREALGVPLDVTNYGQAQTVWGRTLVRYAIPFGATALAQGKALGATVSAQGEALPPARGKVKPIGIGSYCTAGGFSVTKMIRFVLLWWI